MKTRILLILFAAGTASLLSSCGVPLSLYPPDYVAAEVTGMMARGQRYSHNTGHWVWPGADTSTRHRYYHNVKVLPSTGRTFGPRSFPSSMTNRGYTTWNQPTGHHNAGTIQQAPE